MTTLASIWLLACTRPPPLAFVERGPPAREPAPLVIVVHGLGDRPENIVGLVESCGLPVRVVAPRGPEAYHDGWSWFDVSFGPDGASFDADGVVRATDALGAFVDRIAKQRPTVGQPVVTGFSQGGILSFSLAVRHPDRIGLAVPIAGALPSGADVPASGPPVRAIHGGRDEIVDVADAEATVARLRQAGWDASLEVDPGAAHQVTEPMRADLCAAVRSALP